MSLSINMTQNESCQSLISFQRDSLSVIDFTIMFLECANNTLNPKDSNTFRILFYQFYLGVFNTNYQRKKSKISL